MAKKTLMDDFMEMDEAGKSTGTTIIAELVPVSLIKLSDKFQSLFPLDEELVDELADKMKTTGYDSSRPVDIWKETDLLIDGHTRLAAAKKAGLFEIPAYKHSFPDEREAEIAALSFQLDRRNLTPAEMVNVAERYIELGGYKNMKALRKKLSSSLNVSPRTADKLIAISKDEAASEELKENGSVNTTYNSLMERLHPENHTEEEPQEQEVNEENTTLDSFDSLGNDEQNESYSTDTENDEYTSENQDDTESDDVQDFYVDSAIDNSKDESEGNLNEWAGDNDNVEKSKNIKRESEKPFKDKGPSDGSRSYVEADIKARAYGEGFKAAFFYVLSMVIKGRTPEEIYSWCSEDGELSPDAVEGLKPSDADIKAVKALYIKNSEE